MSEWEQLELPFDPPVQAPDSLREKIQASLREIASRPLPPEKYKTGFILLQDEEGVFTVITTPNWDALGLSVRRPPDSREILETTRAVSEYERDRHLADAVADRLRPRDLTQEALRKKAQERGVI